MYFLKVFLTGERFKNTHFIRASFFFFSRNFLSSYNVVFFIADFFIPEFLLLMTNFNTTVFPSIKQK